MEQAIAEYPLALAYRNLAVYWNSEGDPAKGNEYTDKALALDPKILTTWYSRPCSWRQMAGKPKRLRLRAKTST
jgi:hypothetical protein